MGERSHAIFKYTYLIHLVHPETEDILETLAEANHFDIAHAAFTAALACKSNATIQLRQKSRVVRTGRTGDYDPVSKTVTLLGMEE